VFNKLCSYLFGSCLLAAFLVSSAKACVAQNVPLVVSASTDKKVYTPAETVTVTCVVENVGADALYVPAQLGYGNGLGFTLSIFDKQGREITQKSLASDTFRYTPEQGTPRSAEDRGYVLVPRGLLGIRLSLPLSLYHVAPGQYEIVAKHYSWLQEEATSSDHQQGKRVRYVVVRGEHQSSAVSVTIVQ